MMAWSMIYVLGDWVKLNLFAESMGQNLIAMLIIWVQVIWICFCCMETKHSWAKRNQHLNLERCLYSKRIETFNDTNKNITGSLVALYNVSQTDIMKLIKNIKEGSEWKGLKYKYIIQINKLITT